MPATLTQLAALRGSTSRGFLAISPHRDANPGGRAKSNGLRVSRQLAGLRKPKASPTLSHQCLWRILIAPCSHAMKPLLEALSLRFLENKMGRVFRSLAFGYGEAQRMKVQTMEQQLSLTEKNGCRREVE